MRMSGGVLAVALLAGLGVGGGGRPPSLDMVSARLSADVPTPTHVGHWAAPVSGRAAFITLNIMEAGTGAGDVTLGVLVVGAGVVCTLTVPCATASGTLPSESCPENAIPAGAEVHLEYSHTCASPPHGNSVFGFEWAR